MMKIRRANTAAATARRAATPIGGTDRAMSKGAEPSSSSTGRRISSRSTTPRRTSTPTPAPRSGATTPKRNWTEFHQKSKQFVEEREQFLDKLREQQDKDALTECTFQPQLKSKPPVGGGDFKARANSLSSLYEKGREVQQKKAERMERIRQELIEKEMAECSFRPEIRPRVRRVETPPSPPPILRQSYSAATRRGNFSLVGGRGSDGSCLLAGASPHWGPSPHDDSRSPAPARQVWEESFAPAPISAQRAWEEAFAPAFVRYSTPCSVPADEQSPQDHRPVFPGLSSNVMVEDSSARYL